MPSGFVYPPIVDPDQAGPPYRRGQAVDVDGATVVYEGTSRADGRLVARFQVAGQLPSHAGALFFLPNGPSPQLSRVGDLVTSDPFALATADPSTLFSWRIGSRTVVWELGAIDD
jgi:hypothetical protein